MTVETTGAKSQAVCLVDGPIDDYENLDGELAEMPHKDGAALYVPSLRGLKS